MIALASSAFATLAVDAVEETTPLPPAVNTIAELFMLAGALVAIIAAVGLIRFKTPYARFHAAGKASPIAVLVTSIGAGLELGWDGAALLAVSVGSMMLTLPFAVSLLYRAMHRAAPGEYLQIDELKSAEDAVEAEA